MNRERLQTMIKSPFIPCQDPYQRILETTYARRIPFTAHFELTYRCNLSCVHCYATDRHREGELTASEVENIMEQLVEANCLFLCFTGGEIFCRADLIQILRAARSRGFAIRLLTNGSLVTARLADEIARIVPLSVEISLYAMTPALHDKITGVKGSHAQTMATIRMCLERGMNTAIKTILLKYNLVEYPALSAFAQEVGARFVFDYMLSPADNGAQPMENHGLSENDIYEFVMARGAPQVPHLPRAARGGKPPGLSFPTEPREARSDAALRSGPSLRPSFARHSGLREGGSTSRESMSRENDGKELDSRLHGNDRENQFAPAGKPAMSDPICGQGCNTMAITPFGDVLPCLAIRQSVGNLRERKFKEIWVGSALDKVRNARYAFLKECSECALLPYCTRCSGVALSECGNIFGRSESACMAARAVKRAVELLSGREARE